MDLVYKMSHIKDVIYIQNKYVLKRRVEKLKKLLCLALLLSLTAVLAVPIVTYSASLVTQSASTMSYTAVSIKAQDYQYDVSNITFPIGSPGDMVSNPYNNVNSNASPQVFGQAGVARPVVTLVNTDVSHQYAIYYNVSSWSNAVVASEYYIIKDKGSDCSSDAVLTNAVVFGVNTSSGATIAPAADINGSKKDLYLKVILGNTGGLNGSSTISIISEPY
jgi:hypothetical protein